MFFNFLLLDIGIPSGFSITGAAVGIAFFLVFAAVAVIAFRLLKRTMKMAFRMAIVAVILLIAIVGGISFMLFSSPVRSTRPTPTQQPPRTR